MKAVMKDAAFWTPGPGLQPHMFTQRLARLWSGLKGGPKNTMESQEVTKTDELCSGIPWWKRNTVI